jgi:hypothetical protein
VDLLLVALQVGEFGSVQGLAAAPAELDRSCQHVHTPCLAQRQK